MKSNTPGGEPLRIGGVDLRLPPGCTAKLLSRNENRAAVLDFVLESPDQTVYHHEPYFEHARRDDAGQCDLAMVIQDGHPTFAMPVHFRPPNRVTTGYSGILFPPAASESALRRSIRSVGAFFAANPALTFDAIQSAQATSYEDSRRLVFMRRYLADLDLKTQPVFTRVLRLDEHPTLIEEAPGTDSGGVTITPGSLDNALLGTYEAETRNQIRRALRDGLSVSACFGDRGAGTGSMYGLIQPLHEATWARSGWSPHSLEYWLGLSAAVNGVEGSSDLVVTVRDPAGRPLAGVVCHRYRGRALYWSGCSGDDAGVKRANPLCLHAAVSICGATGTELFEIGRFDARERSPKERAVTSYKSQFRGELFEVVNLVRRPAGYRATEIGRQIRSRAGALKGRLAK